MPKLGSLQKVFCFPTRIKLFGFRIKIEIQSEISKIGVISAIYKSTPHIIESSAKNSVSPHRHDEAFRNRSFNKDVFSETL